MKRIYTALALTSSVALGTGLPGQVRAESICDGAYTPLPANCVHANAGLSVTVPVPPNSEVVDGAPGAGFADIGFSISIDGETIAGAEAPSNPDRQADVLADRFDMQVRFDGFAGARQLNVLTEDLAQTARAGSEVTFRTSTNYPAYIARAEVRILQDGRVLSTLPVSPNGQTQWTMPSQGSESFSYVLRAYDDKGRFDETQPRLLTRNSVASAPSLTGPVIAAGQGEDNSRVRGIPVAGGLVTASGKGARPGGTVTVMGEAVPVDASGAFVVTRILPTGDHIVTVEDGPRRLRRDVRIPQSEWFRVGIVDLTFGKRLQDDLAEADPDYEDTFIDGRVAVYTKGQTASGWTITGSADTGNGPLEDIFRRLDDKDPRRVIQRLRDNDGYLTFGDDSTQFDDTPTSGRVYLRVERDRTRLTWGDFKTDLGTDRFLSSSRTLYGAEVRHGLSSYTQSGQSRAEVTVYAAQPDTLPQRDILRGTGGSIYFLTRQDINQGSETISVQIVDPDTGRVVETRQLVPGTDYGINYLQGVLTLTTPLTSSASDGGLIGSDIGAFDVNLIAQYEYTPLTGDLDGSSIGARVVVRPTDALAFGLSLQNEETGIADQTGISADATLSFGSSSEVFVEVARTDGPGFGQSVTTNGGLTIVSGGGAGGAGTAWRLEADMALSDLGVERDGRVELYAGQKTAGFSTLTEDITEDQTLFGLRVETALSERLTFGADFEHFDRKNGERKVSGEARLSFALSGKASLTGALGHIHRNVPGVSDESGRRTDVALRFDYESSERLSWFLFGQASVDTSGEIGPDNRLGAGLAAQVTDTVRATAEVSDGDKGLAARAQIGYAPAPDTEIYAGYVLDPTRIGSGASLIGNDEGTLVVGGRKQLSESVATYFENSLDLFGERRSLTESYGVTYTPNARWTYSASTEIGDVRDSVDGDFERLALSFGAAYDTGEGVRGRARLEYRTEDGDGIEQDRETWGFSGGYERQVSDDWRLLTGLDALISRSDEDAFRDGEYVKADIGYAYRPVLNERLNLLFRYGYLRDLPGEDQVNADGDTEGPLQISHVLSVDSSYDLSQRLTFGAKYGVRLGRIADRGTEDFTKSTAHLGILRLDWHVVHEWDLGGEVRALRDVQADTTEYGALVAIYRHFGDNAKVGLGYEFGRVSDDVTDIDYDAQGLILNVIAKF